MKIILKTLSPLLSSSGESSAHIDADVKYDMYGLPYISGKTIKGLLRESTLEVCEISGFEEKRTDKIINFLFGSSGEKNGGELKFNNLKLPGYNAIIKELKTATLSPKFIQSYFTTIKKQTRINDEGVAEDTSLRTYRLIKKGEEFEGEIENAENEYKAILENALLNLRYIGTRRNRGFGKVKVESSSVNVTKPSTETAITATEYPDTCKLSYLITTKTPLQISKQVGNQNTVDTEDFIPAQNIRGLVAQLLIKKYCGDNDAHKNEHFKKYILDGTVKFNNAIPYENGKTYETVPIAFEYDKTEKKGKRTIYNSLASKGHKKSEKGWYRAIGASIEIIEVNTISNFHSTRMNDRIAGRSTKDEGAIFYYESIEEGQSFSGEITGDFNALNEIKKTLEANNGLHRIGKSKTAQYSLISFSDISIGTIKAKTNTRAKGSNFYIVFQSPVIFYNDNGVAIPDEQYLREELKPYNIQIDKIASGNTFVENYMGTWRSKTNRDNAFAMGTTLLVTATGEVDLKAFELAHIGKRTNEGYGQIKALDLLDEYKKIEPKVDLPQIAGEPLNEIVKDIIAAYDIQENENKIKTDAIEKSRKFDLDNHQVYRLRGQLNNSENITEWQNFLKSIEKKNAGKALLKKHLWDDLYNLTGSNAVFKDQKQYWTTFFNALRVKSKRPKHD